MKIKGIIWQIIAYAIALVGAVICYQNLGDYHIILKFLLADIVGTLVIFLFSRISGNSSFYDPYWSLQPIVIAFCLFEYFQSSDMRSYRSWVVLLMVSFWGLRLTFNFLRGWKGLEEQDWRYDDLAEKHGKNYWWVSFSGIHMFPTLLVFAGCLPLFFIYSDSAKDINWLDFLALFIIFASILIETIADQQLYRYKKSGPPPGQTFSEGLWAEVRHPNYLGEIGFWWGIFLFGLAATTSSWWAVIGALSITLLFVYISLPMIDERMMRKRPDYKQHMDNTPALFPKIFS